jgi:hypothetical protein
MATFGPIASAAPNVLFDAAKLDRDVQSFQRNQLLMQNAQKDQAGQQYERDTNARIALARSLVNLPEDQAAAQWGAERARLQQAGFGQGLPEQFPGMERLKAVASSDLTTFQRMQIEEKRRLTETMSGLVGGGPAPAAAPGYTPVSMGAPMPTAAPAPVGTGGTVRADNASAAALRDEAMRTLEGPALEARLAEISAGRAQALTGQGPGTQYRANPGEGGVFAGLPAPAPGVPVLASSSPTVGASGLTADQTNTLKALVLTNPGGVPAMRAQFLRENAMAQERAGDNARRDAQFEWTRQQQTAQFEEQRRQREEANRRADSAERRAEESRAASQRTSEQQRLATITQQEAPQLERIGSSSGIIANGNRLLSMIDSGKLEFGMGASTIARARNAAGLSNENSINFADLERHVTESVNAVLSQAAGPQTDQDAQRARDQILNNLNDKEAVRRGLQSLNGAMERARQIATARVQGRRRELGLPEADLSPYTNLPPNVTEGGRASAAPAASGPSPGTVENGYRFKGGNPADPNSWEPV